MALPDFLRGLINPINPNYLDDPNDPRKPPVLPNPPAPRPLPAPAPPNALYGRHMGPSLAPRPSRRQELAEMKDAYAATNPGRLKSGLMNALRGFAGGMASGGGLGAGLGGAVAGGAFGAIDPRGAREAEFEAYEKPQILQRFAMDDAEENARRDAQMDAIRMQDIAAGVDLKQAQAAKARQPAIAKPPAPAWKLGRHNASGQFRWFDASAPDAGDYTPHVQQPNQPSRFVVNDRGDYVDVVEETKKGRKVKAFQRPRVGPKPKAEKKFAAITDVRAAAEKAGVSESQMAAQFRAAGYEIVR